MLFPGSSISLSTLKAASNTHIDVKSTEVISIFWKYPDKKTNFKRDKSP